MVRLKDVGVKVEVRRAVGVRADVHDGNKYVFLCGRFRGNFESAKAALGVVNAVKTLNSSLEEAGYLLTVYQKLAVSAADKGVLDLTAE